MLSTSIAGGNLRVKLLLDYTPDTIVRKKNNKFYVKTNKQTKNDEDDDDSV